MSINPLTGKVILNSIGLSDISAGTRLNWIGTLSFADQSGKYLGTDVQVGDVILFDTSSSELSTVTSYAIVTIVSASFNTITATFKYLSTNNNLTGPPDLTAVVDQPGVLTRRLRGSGRVALPSNDIQLLPDVFSTYVGNDQANAIKIGIIGDSISSIHTARTVNWSMVLESVLNQTGTRAFVHNFAIGGARCFTALTDPEFPGTGTITGSMTMVDRCISAAPDLVIIMLGANDAASDRSESQIIDDAISLVTALRAGLPSAKLVFAIETIHDTVNFTPASAKNKGVIPYLNTFRTTGLLTGCWSPETLDDPVSPSVANILTKSVAFNAAIQTIAQLDGYFNYDHWKTARVGCLMVDGLHQDATGSEFIASAVIKGLGSMSFADTMFPGLRDYSAEIVGQLDAIFNAVLTPSGDGYVAAPATVAADNVAYEASLMRKINHTTWMYPYKTRHVMYPLSIGNIKSSQTFATIDGGPPNSTIQLSTNDSVFTDTTVTTDAYGYGLLVLQGSQFPTPGNYVLRFKAANEVYGPYTLVVSQMTDTAVTQPYGDATAALATTEFVDQTRDVQSHPQSAPYTLALIDRGCSVDTNSNVTIPSNAVVPFPIGSVVLVTNTSASPIVISIDSDTLHLTGTALTGPRTIASWGVVAVRKVNSTEWVIVGNGLS